MHPASQKMQPCFLYVFTELAIDHYIATYCMAVLKCDQINIMIVHQLLLTSSYLNAGMVYLTLRISVLVSIFVYLT